MDLLSNVASKLMHEKNKEIFKKGTTKKIEDLLKTSKKAVKTKSTNKFDFVCISTCPTGVAHTNMAAEAMEK